MIWLKLIFIYYKHSSKATISIKTSNFLICFCNFDLSCPIAYLKKVHLSNLYCLVLLTSGLQPCFNKGHGMCYPVYGMGLIKDPLLLIGKSSPCSGSSRCPLLHPKMSFTMFAI